MREKERERVCVCGEGRKEDEREKGRSEGRSRSGGTGHLRQQIVLVVYNQMVEWDGESELIGWIDRVNGGNGGGVVRGPQ